MLLLVPGRLLDTAEFCPPPPDTDGTTLTQQTQFRPGPREGPAPIPAGGLCCIQMAACSCKQQHSQCLLPLVQLRAGAGGACTTPCQWPACEDQPAAPETTHLCHSLSQKLQVGWSMWLPAPAKRAKDTVQLSKDSLMQDHTAHSHCCPSSAQSSTQDRFQVHSCLQE